VDDTARPSSRSMVPSLIAKITADYEHHQASKAMAVARKYDMLTKKLPPGELLKVNSLNSLLAMTVSDQQRQQKRPRRRYPDEWSTGKVKVEVADLASLVIHLWRDWAGCTQGYEVVEPEKRELFEEALPDVIRMLTDLAEALDIDLTRPSPVIDGDGQELPSRGLLM
jgi:hypothetical protein